MRNKAKDQIDLQRQNLDLKQELQFKNKEIEDLEFRLRAMHKQQSIWENINQPKATDRDTIIKQLTEQNTKLKNQLISIINEKQFQEQQLQQLKQKVNDLKYTNQQMKKLNEKSNLIHEKQLEILKNEKGGSSSQQMINIKKQKEKLETTLEKCEKIAKEMQEFYMNEIQSLTNLQEQQKTQIESLQKQKRSIITTLKQKNEQYLEIKIKYDEIASNIEKNEYKVRENVIEELVKIQSHEKRWQLIVQQVKQRYEREIAELKDKIKFLIVKLQSVQDSKYSNEGNMISSFNQTNFSNSLMTQSKMASSATSESFRFTPGNSFASSIKESLSRRDTNSMRTPNKYKNMRNFGKYLQHTNA